LLRAESWVHTQRDFGRGKRTFLGVRISEIISWDQEITRFLRVPQKGEFIEVDSSPKESLISLD